MDTEWSVVLSDIASAIPNPFNLFRNAGEKSENRPISGGEDAGAGLPVHVHTQAQKSVEEVFFEDHKELLDKVGERIAVLRHREQGLEDEVRKIDGDIDVIARRRGKMSKINDSDRVRIKGLINRKRMIMKQVTMTNALRVSLETQMFTLQNATIHNTANEAMKEMNATMQDLVKGMKVRSVEKTVEKTHEMAEQADEVASIMGQSVGSTFVEDSEVEELLGNWFAEEEPPARAQESAPRNIDWPETARDAPLPADEDDLQDRELDAVGAMLFS